MKWLCSLILGITLGLVSMAGTPSFASGVAEIDRRDAGRVLAPPRKITKPQASNSVSRKQAIKQVKRRYDGKVLKARPVLFQGDLVYKVKMLSTKGVIFYVYVDANTGSMRKHSR